MELVDVYVNRRPIGYAYMQDDRLEARLLAEQRRTAALPEPGLGQRRGEARHDRFVAALYRAGYDYVVSIEHEDRAFEGTEELVKRGFLIARDALRPLIH